MESCFHGTDMQRSVPVYFPPPSLHPQPLTSGSPPLKVPLNAMYEMLQMELSGSLRKHVSAPAEQSVSCHSEQTFLSHLRA